MVNKYAHTLMAQLRNRNTGTEQFRQATKNIGKLLLSKVVALLPTHNIEIVSILRSGDALVDTFISHFPCANVSKILIQRDEITALPHFQYMKLAASIASGKPVVILEPMIATGGTLQMVITLLQAKGVQEKNIIIATICTAPEGVLLLKTEFPQIKVVMMAMDVKLNEQKYIVPGLGDFGDRYFGTGTVND